MKQQVFARIDTSIHKLDDANFIISSLDVDKGIEYLYEALNWPEDSGKNTHDSIIRTLDDIRKSHANIYEIYKSGRVKACVSANHNQFIEKILRFQKLKPISSFVLTRCS